MYVSVPKALISTMQGFQTILLLNVCQCCKSTHQYHARVSNNISTQCMSVFRRHSLVPCKGFKQYQYSMYVSIPKAFISHMQVFQTILVLNVCQYFKRTHQHHARVSNNISTQCMSVFQSHSFVTCKGFKRYQYTMYVSVPKALIITMQGFQTILVLNVCQCSKGTHQYHARVSNNISTQCMSVLQRHSLVTCTGFKQYQYSMYVSVPKSVISTMQGFQTKLVLNVCQCSKGTHQYHARVSTNISTQCMSVFQRHSLVPCKGFNQYYYSMYVRVPKALINTMQEFVLKQYQYSMYVSVAKALISNMHRFQTILVLNVCQCSKGCTHQYHARVFNIITQCMSMLHSLVPCKGFKQYQYSMYVSVPKGLISTMQSGFQVSNNISTQYMSVFQRHSLVTCKGFKQYQYSMYVSVPKALISTMQGFQTILELNVCQCSKGTHQYHARVSRVFSVPKLISTCKGFKQYYYSIQCSKGMQGFQTILELNVCQCSKCTHQYHARVSILVLNVCQCYS